MYPVAAIHIAVYLCILVGGDCNTLSPDVVPSQYGDHVQEQENDQAMHVCTKRWSFWFRREDAQTAVLHVQQRDGAARRMVILSLQPDVPPVLSGVTLDRDGISDLYVHDDEHPIGLHHRDGWHMYLVILYREIISAKMCGSDTFT